MPEVPIPFPVTSAPGKNVHDSAGRLINCYSEDLVNGARSQTVWRRAPGLTSFKLTAHQGWRGGMLVGGTLYAAFDSGQVATYDDTGLETTLGGILPGSGKAFWAHNNKIPADIVVVDPDEGASLVTTSVTPYPDADVGVPNSVCFLDGYFFFTHGDGLVIASGINNTSVNALDFINVYGNPAGLYRAVPFGELYLLGSNTIEIWQNTANPVGFPFSRVTVIPRGIIGRFALTGWEPGFGRGLFFVGDDRKVYTLNGYQPVAISTPDVERAISAFLDGGGSIENIELFCYVVSGRSCIVLNMTSDIAPTGPVAIGGPSYMPFTADSGFRVALMSGGDLLLASSSETSFVEAAPQPAPSTWVFDIDLLRWHERHSYLSKNWRPYASVNAFGKWLAGDSQSNNILQITDTVQTDLGYPIDFDIYSGPVTAFPNRLRVSQVTFDMARGVGIAIGADPQQVDPRVYISWTDDGGLNWSNPIERKLGRQQTSPAPVRVNRVGQTKDQGRRFRITVYDPVQVELTGGKMSAEMRNY